MLLGIELGDLVALNPESRHKAFLAEDEGIDVVLHRRGRTAFCLPLVHDDDARTNADLEPFSLVELLQHRVVHEEHRVAVGLRACLESERGPGRSGRTRPFRDAWENEDGVSLCAQRLRPGELPIQALGGLRRRRAQLPWGGTTKEEHGQSTMLLPSPFDVRDVAVSFGL